MFRVFKKTKTTQDDATAWWVPGGFQGVDLEKKTQKIAFGRPQNGRGATPPTATKNIWKHLEDF